MNPGSAVLPDLGETMANSTAADPALVAREGSAGQGGGPDSYAVVFRCGRV